MSFRCVVLVCCLTAPAFGPAVLAEDVPLSRISFGSCAKRDQPQPIWEAIAAGQPELFVFLGDNIYGDSPDMDVLRAKYALLNEQPGFRKLQQVCPVVATWDDHDYGKDDAGAEFEMRRESQQVFLDFLGVEKDDPRRTQEGVYWSKVYGPAGRRVQIILLDARYFRGPLKKGYDAREPGEGYRGKYAPSGNYTKASVRFANEINPYRTGLTFFDVNYGNILIDWTVEDPVVRLQVCDEKGAVVLQQRNLLSELQP